MDACLSLALLEGHGGQIIKASTITSVDLKNHSKTASGKKKKDCFGVEIKMKKMCNEHAKPVAGAVTF